MTSRFPTFDCEICTVWVCMICDAKDYAPALDSDKCRRCFYADGFMTSVQHRKGIDRPHYHEQFPPDPTVEANLKLIVRRLVGQNGSCWISDLIVGMGLDDFTLIDDLVDIGVLALSDHDAKCHLVLLREQIDRIFPDLERKSYVDDGTINERCEAFDRQRNSRVIPFETH